MTVSVGLNSHAPALRTLSDFGISQQFQERATSSDHVTVLANGTPQHYGPPLHSSVADDRSCSSRLKLDSFELQGMPTPLEQ